MARPRFSFEDYTVGWICALPIELAAAMGVLDEEHHDLPQDATDTNVYSLGRIGEHKVAIACLPAGQIGTNSAATVASEMRSKFVSIRFGLMVGIGGGVPSAESDIRLGDVVISQPHIHHGGVVQYDYGKIGAGGHPTRTGSLNAPPTVLLNALSKLRSNHLSHKSKLSTYLSNLVNRLPDFASEKAGSDILFDPTYDHIGGKTCDKCSRDRIVERTPRGSGEIVVHCGTVASGNRVIKDGITRDKLSLELGGVLCFEMEAAGLMNSFPCLVIRGICDYADSHKNKKWQPYAAATAAACAKELLSAIPPADVAKARTVDEAINASDKDSQCLRDLRSTNPRHDKARIEGSKDDLLKDSYAWILDDPAFLGWLDNIDTRLLWIKGDPGKGKTMMMIALVGELLRRLETNPGSGVLSYFFCQSTDPRLNNAVSILKSLIYLLVIQQETLIRHLRKEYDHQGSSLFDGPNVLDALWEILSNMLNDSSLARVYLMVDALDECDSELAQLLDEISRNASDPSSRVKWLVASRNRPDIEEQLRPDDFSLKISLELNSAHISRAVHTFIDSKVRELAKLKRYNSELQEEVRGYLYENAEGTFLWVALVCKRLQKIPLWKVKTKLIEVLKEFPPGLEPLYERMMKQIQDGEDAELCTRILSSITLTYRPIHLKELVSVAGLPEELSEDLESLDELVKLCGSFLIIRGKIIYFVHQSARDYFSTGRGSKIFSSQAEGHLRITCRSLEVMSNSLKRDICGLQMPGTLLSEAKSGVNQDPLAHIQYACCYWVDHLRQVDSLRRDQISGNVHIFLQRHFLHWLEALSLIGEISKGALMITDLQSLLTRFGKNAELLAMVNDGRRFILNNRSIIEKAPLQTYSSALVFSPKKSIVRTQFSNQFPAWIKSFPVVEEGWSPSLQTLEGHSSSVTSVAFSPDGKRLASGSDDGIVMLWDAETGVVQSTLKSYSGSVMSMAFSPDGKRLASGSDDRTVMLWDAETRAVQSTLKGHSGSVMSVAFSPDGKRLASGSYDCTVMLWDAETGVVQSTLKGHSGWVISVAFSPDGKRLASGSYDCTVMLWDAGAGVVQSTLKGYSGSVMSVAFSPDGKRLVSGSYTVMLWDAETGAVQSTLKGHSGLVMSVAFSPDGKRLASGSDDCTVMLWDAETGAVRSTLKGYWDAKTYAQNSLYALDETGRWVTWKAHKVLFLPSDRRPNCCVVQDNILAIGHPSGKLTVLGFDPNVNPLPHPPPGHPDALYSSTTC